MKSPKLKRKSKSIDKKKSPLLKKMKQYLQTTQKDWNYITPLDFYNNYYNKKNKDYFLLDLRKKKDFKQFHIKGSVNIFWLDLLDNLNKIPKNKQIFLICYVGHTSSQILTILKLLGYNNVTSIKFGYGKSPVFGTPVAGWLNYNFPIVGKI